MGGVYGTKRSENGVHLVAVARPAGTARDGSLLVEQVVIAKTLKKIGRFKYVMEI